MTVVGLLGAVVARRGATWGASRAEALELLPGDELIADPADVTTRAVTIRAEPEDVWPWLVQIGTGRGGWYSYDWLERLFGVPVTNTDVIEEDWQELGVGDAVCLVPPGWMGLERGISLPVVGLVPNAHIVLLQAPPTTRWDGVWSFHVRDSGHGQSRLIVRSRTSRPSGPGRLLAVVMSPWTGLATLVMERGMLLGLQERAERTVAAEAPPPDRRD